MVKRLTLSILFPSAWLLITASSAQAASLSKSYSYFSVDGITVEEIERELKRRGPQVSSSNMRHPGATRMEFKTRISYGQSHGRCIITKAIVTVDAKMFLPRWTQRKRASPDTRLIWDTLAADIKRHEESHVVIAMNHARELEKSLQALSSQRSCDAAQEKAEQISAQILATHDIEQDRFDRIEGKNFESRFLRLLQYRPERIEAGRLIHP